MGARRSPTAIEEAQEAIVGALAAGSLSGGAWDQLDVARAFAVCMRAILAAFYSHPWAWNEIGYGGPAYPQGYMRLGPRRHAASRTSAPAPRAEDPVRVAGELGP